MKKIIMMMAAIAAFAFTSCEKNEPKDPAQANDIKINITVSELSGDATRAVKTDWANGDKLNLWFGETPSGGSPELVLVKEVSGWGIVGTPTSEQISKIESSSTFSVYYESGNDLSKYSISDYNIEAGLTNSFRKNNLTAVCRNITYTFNEGTLTATISGWKFATGVQITVTGVPDDFTTSNTTLFDNYSWLSGLFHVNRYNGGMNIYKSAKGAGAVTGTEANSLSFYFAEGAAKNDANIQLTISNGTTSKTFNKSDVTLEAGGEDHLVAVKIPFSKFE